MNLIPVVGTYGLIRYNLQPKQAAINCVFGGSKVLKIQDIVNIQLKDM